MDQHSEARDYALLRAHSSRQAMRMGMSLMDDRAVPARKMKARVGWAAYWPEEHALLIAVDLAVV